MVNPSLGSWSKSPEDLVREGQLTVSESPKPLAFAPRHARNPRAYDKVPVVMVVATEPTRALHRGLFEAVELLEKTSGAFKVALFTDSRSNREFRQFDWMVEHCFDESNWQAISSENWLDMVFRRLRNAVDVYGVSHVVACRSGTEGRRSIMDLGARFGVRKEIVNAATEHFDQKQDQPTDTEHSSMRGWIEHQPSGRTHHLLTGDRFAGVSVTVNLEKKNYVCFIFINQKLDKRFYEWLHEKGIAAIVANIPRSIDEHCSAAVSRALVSGMESHGWVFVHTEAESAEAAMLDEGSNAGVLLTGPDATAYTIIFPNGNSVYAESVEAATKHVWRYVRASRLAHALV